MERIPGSERTREKLKAVIEGSNDGGGTSELVRLAARLIIEEALEGETRDALGRDYYAAEHAPAPGIATAIDGVGCRAWRARQLAARAMRESQVSLSGRFDPRNFVIRWRWGAG